MTNEEARELPIEGIAEMRLAYILLNWRDNLDNTTATPQDVAKSLIRILKDEFGYHRIDQAIITKQAREDERKRVIRPLQELLEALKLGRDPSQEGG